MIITVFTRSLVDRASVSMPSASSAATCSSMSLTAGARRQFVDLQATASVEFPLGQRSHWIGVSWSAEESLVPTDRRIHLTDGKACERIEYRHESTRVTAGGRRVQSIDRCPD